MKGLIQLTLAAGMVAGSAASHQHHHQHFHAKKSNVVDKRDPDVVTQVVPGPTATKYVLDGKVLTPEEAAKGLDGGDFVVIGETIPSYVPPPPLPKPSTTADMGAQFIESAAPTKAAPPPPPPPPPPPKPTTAPPPPPSSAPSGGQGLDSPFPSGKVPCSHFPSDYGAVALEWLGLGGWAGIQQVPDYSPDSSSSISNIITAISGQDCGSESMCSYACPPGYQKTQWPKAQGSTAQSVGGLYCNANGFLELTRPESNTLCEAGVGGVTIQNDLDEEVSTCRTDYPGTESMVIPAIAQPHSKVTLCNPDQNNYYSWQGMATSAQYYVNKKGLQVADACCWDSPGGDSGNWAPINLGVGMASDGITYLSIFQNLPTSNAKLDFNVEITGDVSSECSYIDGVWTGGATGCTTGMPKGGSAIVRYF